MSLCPKIDYVYKAECIRVVDGDTIDCIVDLGFSVKIKHRFRLLGIDAPELRGKKANKPMARKAKAFVEDMLMPDSGQVYIRSEKSDSFGRYLADVWYYNGDKLENLNNKLIKEGLAKPYEK